jgi:CRP-like cAMP-binding protein
MKKPAAEVEHPTPSDNRLLAALARSDRDLIAEHLSPIALRRGDVLFEPGEDVDTTYFPCRRAMISLRLATRAGQEIEAATVGREGALGGVVSAGHKPAYGRAVVHIPGGCFCIETARLEELKARSPAFGDLFARYADVLLAQVMQSAACNALHSIEERCCRWLLAAHDRAGDHSFPMTQQDLSDMLGVQRTSVTAVSSKLQAQRLISYRRGVVEVLDREGLERAACECYESVERHFARLLPGVQPPRPS